MLRLKCSKHKLDKDTVFCLEEDCKERMACVMCIVRDQLHKDHHCIVIKGIIEDNSEELKRLFGNILSQIGDQNGNIK